MGSAQSNASTWLPRLDAEVPRLIEFLGSNSRKAASPVPGVPPTIGVLKGTGIGKEVIEATFRVLSAVEQALGIRFKLSYGGPIAEEAEARFGQALPDSVVEFCRGIFDEGGAILSGPGGGRYVYDLRRRFDLFCKFVPVRPWPELASAGKLLPAHLRGVDILIVRDNVSGVYQGESRTTTASAGRIVEHRFSYEESDVLRLAHVAARAAANRRGKMHVIVKDGGLPAMSALWREAGATAARSCGVEAVPMNVDRAAYELIQHPADFDVLVAPNLFGDVLADITGVLLASRGVTFSGNFNGDGHAVYQTNHGCAHDLTGRDMANPAGQILSLAMLLRESLGIRRAADCVESALAAAWRQGWRTADVAEPGCQIVGTRAMADCVAENIVQLTESRRHEAQAVAG